MGGTTSTPKEKEEDNNTTEEEDIMETIINKLRTKTHHEPFHPKRCQICQETPETTHPTPNPTSNFPIACGFLCDFSQTLTRTINANTLGRHKTDARVLREDLLKWLGKCFGFYAIYIELQKHYSKHKEVQMFYHFTDQEMLLFCKILSWCQARLTFLKEAAENPYILFFPHVTEIEKAYPAKDKRVLYYKERQSLARYTDYWIFYLDTETPGQVISLQFYRDPEQSKQTADITHVETPHLIKPVVEDSCKDKAWKIEIEDTKITRLKQFFKYYKNLLLKKNRDPYQIHKLIGRQSLKVISE